MNFAQIQPQIVTVVTPEPKIDMDAFATVGPQIARNLAELERLCAAIPNNKTLLDRIDDLRALFATYIPIQQNMLEIGSQDVARYVETERLKIARQAATLAENLSVTSPDWATLTQEIVEFSEGIWSLKPLIEQIRETISEQQVKHHAQRAVGMLRDELVKYGRTGKPITDDSVNHIIHDVLEKTGNTDMNSLLQTWKSSKAGLTPLQWAKQSPDIHDKHIHDTTLNAPIDETVQNLCIMEMYETLKVGLGDKAWVAISKRLKAEGYAPQLVEDAIDHAITKVTR